jgi:hypothetical protein
VSRYRPISVEALSAHLSELLVRRHPVRHPLRVGFDAPRCTEAHAIAAQVANELNRAGRPTAVIDARGFYRDASLRFEFGKTDVESFYSGWLDIRALQREVLNALAEKSQYLPSLRDPDTNRSTRATTLTLAPDGVLIVVGELLQGAGLAFDLMVHFDMSRQARMRRMPEEWQWTLPAFDRYEIEVDPAAAADVVVRCDDPRHLAVREATATGEPRNE